jgi:hypothetical protein
LDTSRNQQVFVAGWALDLGPGQAAAGVQALLAVGTFEFHGDSPVFPKIISFPSRFPEFPCVVFLPELGGDNWSLSIPLD